MKAITVLLMSLSSSFAAAETRIVLSCTGITYNKKAAIQLVVRELTDKTLIADVRATNGESERVAVVKRGDTAIVASGNQKYFNIYLKDGGEKNILLNWNTQILGNQFMHQPMTCEGTALESRGTL